MGGKANDTKLSAAFTDEVYDRTSLHFTSTSVQSLSDTLKSYLEYAQSLEPSKAETDDTTRHPAFGGLIDNLSIYQQVSPGAMPSGALEVRANLAEYIAGLNSSRMGEEGGVELFEYGYISGDGGGGGSGSEYKRLREVRREKGWFEQSSGPSINAVSIGVLDKFITNYNVRVQCERGVAVKCSAAVRKITGQGDVEALTLAYGGGRWEIACNILHQAGEGEALVGEGGVWGEDAIVAAVRSKLEQELGREGVEGAQMYGYRVGLSEMEHVERFEKGINVEEFKNLHGRGE
ncbi:hypothetical protein TrST_g3704 [Triparma strigata]|uniref:Uncharacterized protein n=1 Tax=Triparma strigata TaxID=1606541 RepID=A0A9W7DU19_9STRA|nr:hypothetical protein TrST_g3704 [Triparma strigata]